MKFRKEIIFIFLAALIINGCTPLAKLVVGERGLEIPQIVAHLAPTLKDNQIVLSGRIVIQNPTKSALDLEKIYLEIKDDRDVVLAKDILDWEEPSVTSRQQLETPVKINLSLAVLNKESISVFMRTGFTYKAFGLHIPVENKVAVLYLDALKEAVTKPLYINIFTRFRSTILGNSSVDFALGITNPLNIDMALEGGLIRIYTMEGKDIISVGLGQALFKGSQTSEIKGSIRIGNIWGRLIRSESVKGRPLKFQVTGNLRIPGTEILVPFKIESTVQMSFSLT